MIQIIITTHSPIILSDIPKSNVIFIKKDCDDIKIEDSSKHNETFAANISTLFYDSFFMDKGSIGELAKEQINKLIHALKPMEEKIEANEGTQLKYPSVENVLENLELENVDQVIELINIIGEPIIKQKLNGMFNMCLDKSKEQRTIKIENKIQQLQKELEEIKGSTLL